MSDDRDNNYVIWKIHEVEYTEDLRSHNLFEPLISKTLYNICKEIRSKKIQKTTLRKPWKNNYIFNGILKCNCRLNTGKKLLSYSWYEKKWHNYYKCSSSNDSKNKCGNSPITETHFINEIYNDFIQKMIFSEIEQVIFKELIQNQINDIKRVEDNWKWEISKMIKQIEKELDEIYATLKNTQIDSLKRRLEAEYLEKEQELDSIKVKLEEFSTNVFITKNIIEDYLYFINNIWSSFLQYPNYRKMELLHSMFENITIQGGNIVSFELNPIFKLAMERWKVLTNNKWDGNWNKKSENLDNGLKSIKKTPSDDDVLYGRPTRNRT